MPAASLLPLPDEVTLESAAFLEPLATAVHTLERVKPAPGDHGRHRRSGSARVSAPPGAAGRRRRPGRDVRPPGRRGAARARATSLGADAFVGDRGGESPRTPRTSPSGIGFGLVDRSGRDDRARFRRRSTSSAGDGTLVSLGIVRADRDRRPAGDAQGPDLDWRGRQRAPAFRRRRSGLIQTGKSPIPKS